MYQFSGLKSCRLGFDERTQRCRLRRKKYVDTPVPPAPPLLLWNTGFANDGTQLPLDAIDPHYTATLNPSLLQPLVYYDDNPTRNDTYGAWVMFHGTTVGEQYGLAISFDVTIDPGTAFFTMELRTGNSVYEVLMNGVSISVPAAFYAWPTPVLIDSGFVLGTNTLEIRLVCDFATSLYPTVGCRTRFTNINVLDTIYNGTGTS